MKPQKYTKRPVTIEAMHIPVLNRKIAADAIAWCPAAYIRAIDQHLVISTLEGEMTVSPGDFIIKGVQGEFYPCKPDIFAATYTQAKDTQ